MAIAFFQLNTREELLRERAERLVALDNALAILESNLPASRIAQAREDVERMQTARNPHAACIRAACKMYIEDRDRMLAVFAEAREYLNSES